MSGAIKVTVRRLVMRVGRLEWAMSGGAQLLLWAALAIQSGCIGGEDTPITAVASPTPVPVSYVDFKGTTKIQTAGPSKLQVFWQPTTDTRVAFYNVYDASISLKPVLLKSVRAPTSSTMLNGLTNQGYYLIRVRAADAAGVEDKNIADLPGIPYGGIIQAEVQSSSSALVTYNDGSNADKILVYCKTPTSDFKLMSTVTNVNLTQTLLTGLTSGTLYTCRAALSVANYEENNIQTTSFTPMGSASQVSFSTQPGGANAGDNLGVQPVVTIMDSNNNIVNAGPDSTAQVTLTMSPLSPSIGTLRGSVSVNAVGGIATFTGLNFQELGMKIITATKQDTSSQNFGSPAISFDSNSFSIAPGVISKEKSTITISAAPPLVAPLTANGNSAYTVTLALKDQYSNPVSGIKVQFASSNTLDSLTQPTKVTDSLGVTTGQITATAAGTRTLSITSPTGLSTVVNNAIFVPGTATKVAFSQQPSNSPSGPGGMNTIMVAVQDAQGNTVTSSTASITVSIFTNPGSGNLGGPTTVTAVNGIAAFSGLSIDKTGTGYKLVANSAPLAVAYSNSFNMTPGVPAQVKMAGATSVVSGVCSNAITIQLQDWAGNPSNATANTPVVISGVGSGAFYSSGTCVGNPISGTLNFASGSNLKTLYFMDNHGEGLTIQATDPSAVMSQGTLNFKVTPSQMKLAVPASPKSGICSQALDITTYGVDGIASPVFAATPIQITGLFGTQGRLYTSSLCQGVQIDPNNFSIASGQSNTKLYLLDNKAEILTLNVIEGNGVIATTSGNQALTVLPSKLTLTGPISSVAGSCSTALVLTVKDALNNPVALTADATFNVTGLAGSQGAIYSNNSCTSPLGSSAVIYNGTNYSNVYFKDSVSETVTIGFTDPTGKLASPQAITISVSPSTLAITGPAEVKTGVCSAAFTLHTQDTQGNDTPAITPIVVDLGGAGLGGKFFSDSICSTEVTQFTFNNGDRVNTFYFSSLNPATAPSLTLTATDQANVLEAAAYDFTVTPAPAWIGGGSKLSWFHPGDSFKYSNKNQTNASNYGIHMDASKNFLYAVDYWNHRVTKFDYANRQLVGWIGATSEPSVGSQSVVVSGSNISPTMASLCAVHAGNVTPGWCIGGNSQSATLSQIGSYGGLAYPRHVTDDGANIYVSSSGWGWDFGTSMGSGMTINKYDAATGKFLGWIGRVGSVPSGPGYSSLGNLLVNNCNVTGGGQSLPTPGWCIGGQPSIIASATQPGDGGIYKPGPVRYSGGSLYVGGGGAILRFDADTGVFTGWIGWIAAQPSGPGANASNTCGTGAINRLSPGWCIGGSYTVASALSGGFGGPSGYGGGPNDFYIDATNDLIYTVDMYGGNVLNKYKLSTGEWLTPSLNTVNLTYPLGITSDGTDLFITDLYRLYRFSSSGSPIGWVGQVGNTPPTGGHASCASTNPFNVTPGWCTGGNSNFGYVEGALMRGTSAAVDGAGNVLVGQQGWTNWNRPPGIPAWNISTGAYQGALSLTSAYSAWNNDTLEYPEGAGFDSQSFYAPKAMTVDNGNLYVVDSSPAIKRIDLSTGKVTGQIGIMLSPPTQTASTACDVATFVSGLFGAGVTPGWCLGINSFYDYNNGLPALPNLSLTDGGIEREGRGITSDGTYLYTTDYYWHRIQKWRISDGLYMGWIGQIGNATNLSGCAGTVGTFSTSGWCKGGFSTNSAQWQGGGGMYNPTGIYHSLGELYVIDRVNYRVARYNATSGTFDGWTGRIQSQAGMTGCTVQNKGGYLYPSGGSWCKGGLSWSGGPTYPTQEYGGGFNFQNANSIGITGDGTYLYVSNDYHSRIDKFSLSNGVWLGTVSAIPYGTGGCSGPQTNTWTAAWPVSTATHPYGCNSWLIWTDSQYMYGVEGLRAVWKMNLASGNIIGWYGAIGTQPTDGVTGCTSAAPGTVTPGWCKGGLPNYGLTLGRFTGNILGLTGDANFIYVSDAYTHRITRLPK